MNNFLPNTCKYRLWDKCICEMTYDVTIGFLKDPITRHCVIADTSCGQITYIDKKLQDIILMQCTGIKDSNGVFIYEGDILKYSMNGLHEIIFQVVWDKQKALFEGHVREQNGDNSYKDALYLFLPTDENEKIEIIGNIYETE